MKSASIHQQSKKVSCPITKKAYRILYAEGFYINKSQLNVYTASPAAYFYVVGSLCQLTTGDM